MPEVLKDRILKLGLSMEQDLSPVCLLAVSEDPAVVVLGFYDEDTEARDKDVVYLGRSVPQRQGDVIHQVIVGPDEVRSNLAGKARLSVILE